MNSSTVQEKNPSLFGKNFTRIKGQVQLKIMLWALKIDTMGSRQSYTRLPTRFLLFKKLLPYFLKFIGRFSDGWIFYLENEGNNSLGLKQTCHGKSSYGSKSNSVTLILHLKQKKPPTNSPALVLRDKLEKKRCSKRCPLHMKNEKTSYITRRTRSIHIMEGDQKK